MCIPDEAHQKFLQGLSDALINQIRETASILPECECRA